MTTPKRSSIPTTRPDHVDPHAERTWSSVGFVLVRSEPEDRTRLVNHQDRSAAAAWPAVVMVEASELEAMAYRYDRAANDAGDTWHANADAAWEYLEWEYEGLLSERFEIPAGVNADDHVLERAQRHVWAAPSVDE